MPGAITRRRLLRGGATAAVLGATGCSSEPGVEPAVASEDVYRRIGNPAGHQRRRHRDRPRRLDHAAGGRGCDGGGASRHFVPLPELQEKAGEHMARLLAVPAAMISCGAGVRDHERHRCRAHTTGTTPGCGSSPTRPG